MEKIIGINPVIEVLKSDKNIEKLEVYKKIKKETIKEILNLACRRNIKIFYTDRRTENSQELWHLFQNSIIMLILLHFGKTFEKEKIYSCCAGSGSGSEKFWSDYKKCGVFWSGWDYYSGQKQRESYGNSCKIIDRSDRACGYCKSYKYF